MSFGNRTPESLIARSDSKNPATTCKGITSNGRPCRRAIAQSSGNSPLPSPSRGSGVVAVLEDHNAAAFYCWQHKDQAERLAAREEQKTTLYPLQEKTSIDTLIERVGVLNLDEDVPPRGKRSTRKNDGRNVRKRDTLPPVWNEMETPVMRVPDHVIRSRSTPSRPLRDGRSSVKASWSCCLRADSSDDEQMPTQRSRQDTRPRPGPHGSSRPYRSKGHEMTMPTAVVQTPATRRDKSRPEIVQNRPSSTFNVRPVDPNQRSSSSSATQSLLALIPPHLSPQTTSVLLAELCKPISPADEEGYIYMFWLTPENSESKPDDETASSLLEAVPPARTRRTSEALQRYASVRAHNPTSRSTVLLKIGRAANVHRRLSQWTKQCGQNITLIRYYPYNACTGSASSPKKVPHVHRVERLVHLELADRRVTDHGACEQCGREHKEWFEIEATRKGLKDVDELIRRWVNWAQDR